MYMLNFSLNLPHRDSVLLNMLLPILELVQKFIKESFPKHRIIIASQYNATVKNGKKDISEFTLS